MVFRWLFGSSEGREQPQPQPQARESQESEGDYANGEEAAPPGESAQPEAQDLTSPLKVCLMAIPSFLVDDRPELKLSEYDMARGQFAKNVLALTHNAVRLEMADMWGDILPSLQSRCTEHATSVLKQSDADDVRDWWCGFARFALTASLVEDFVCKRAYDDIAIGFEKETKAIERCFQKVQEKNNVYLEMAIKKMAKAVEEFESDFSHKGFTKLVESWQLLASMLADIYAESEQLIAMIDRWVREPFEYKDLEKQAAKIFTSKKRWGENDGKRGEMIVILCRWVGTEELMREWMYRNLTKKELRSIDKWMDDYRDNRLAIIDRFHQKKAVGC